MSKALGLELLENILNNFPRIFLEVNITLVFSLCLLQFFLWLDTGIWSDVEGENLSSCD